MVCVDPNAIPILSIVDAELMVSMPRGFTAATGMDAFTHAIEGYITKGAWVMSDMFELKAIEMIAKYLPAVVENPSNIKARDGMAMAQYIAGMGFSNVGLGLVHGMAHPLGAYFDVPHGVANALLLPIVMKYNASSCVDKYGDVAKAMVVNIFTLSKLEAANAAVDAVKALAVKVGIPERLRDLKVTEDSLESLAQSAFNDVCTPGNPRTSTLEDILKLYKRAF